VCSACSGELARRSHAALRVSAASERKPAAALVKLDRARKHCAVSRASSGTAARSGGTPVAVKLANATSAALEQIEPDPGIRLPTLGKLLGMPGLRTWRVAKFPLFWCCFERGDPLDVVRLLGKRQDIAAILGDTFASN
jgi:toxin ParE1/3/4